jgi:hypothetical protein
LQRELDQSEERCELVAQATSDGIWDWDLCRWRSGVDEELSVAVNVSPRQLADLIRLGLGAKPRRSGSERAAGKILNERSVVWPWAAPGSGWNEQAGASRQTAAEAARAWWSSRQPAGQRARACAAWLLSCSAAAQRQPANPQVV